MVPESVPQGTGTDEHLPDEHLPDEHLPDEHLPDEHLPDETIVVLALEGLSAFPRAEQTAVHAHLDVCEECRGALAEVLRSEEPEPLPPPGRMRLFKPQTLVAERYKILRYINGGGMGDVYEAQDTRFADTTIALKTISAVAADEECAIRRLEREMRTALLVSHPHACRVHHLDVHRLPGDQGTIHFLTMELIDGETLAERIKRSGPLAEGNALDLSRQLLGALMAAHRKGVLHRDLKPSNVMLRRGDKIDGVVMDFGLAKTLEEPLDARITDSRAFVGSAGYAAPEQLIGDPLTAASDVYAFGIVLFEALTGRLPFEDEGAMRSALRRLEQRAPKPSQLAPHISAGWDRIVGRCLERDPARRFASASEVERALSGLRLGARESSRMRIAIGLGSLLAIGAVGAALLRWAPAPSPTGTLADRSPDKRPSLGSVTSPANSTGQSQSALTPLSSDVPPEAALGEPPGKPPNSSTQPSANGVMPHQDDKQRTKVSASRLSDPRRKPRRATPKHRSPRAASAVKRNTPVPKAKRAAPKRTEQHGAKTGANAEVHATPERRPLDPDLFLIPGE